MSGKTRVVSSRVPEDLAAWADSYAKERGWTRQALLEAALRSFREGCRRGVPDSPPSPASVGRGEQLPAVVDPAWQARRWALDRQRRLNEAKGMR